jgi:hypothetical protein
MLEGVRHVIYREGLSKALNDIRMGASRIDGVMHMQQCLGMRR